METVLHILWSALPGIITGAVLAAWNRKQKKRDDLADRREVERKRDEKVKLDLLVATADLSCAAAVALKYGHTNGETDESLRKYNKAMEQFRDYERDRIAE